LEPLGEFRVFHGLPGYALGNLTYADHADEKIAGVFIPHPSDQSWVAFLFAEFGKDDGIK
jgi:hypothetical protein